MEGGPRLTRGIVRPECLISWAGPWTEYKSSSFTKTSLVITHHQSISSKWQACQSYPSSWQSSIWITFCSFVGLVSFQGSFPLSIHFIFEWGNPFQIPPIAARALGLDYLQKSGDERPDSPNVTLHPLNELPIKSGRQRRCTVGQILLQQLHWSLLSPNLITWNNGGWIKLLVATKEYFADLRFFWNVFDISRGQRWVKQAACCKGLLRKFKDIQMIFWIF